MGVLSENTDCGRWHSKQAVHYLIEQGQSWVSTPLLKGAPAQSSQHVWGTRLRWVVTQNPSSSPSLNHLNSLYAFLYVWVPDWCCIFQLWRTIPLQAIFLSSRLLALRFLLRNPRDLLALLVILVKWGFQERSLAISTSGYLVKFTTSRVCPCREYWVGMGDLDGVIWMTWHLNSIFQSNSHSWRYQGRLVVVLTQQALWWPCKQLYRQQTALPGT